MLLSKPRFLPLWLSLPAIAGAFLVACGPAPCSLTGKNSVAGVALATASGEKCTAEVSGRISDGDGQTIVSIWCAPPTVTNPRAEPARNLTVQLGDPRAIDATSSVTATVQASAGGIQASSPANGKLEIRESAGGKAPLPSGATDNFVRHVTLSLTSTGGADVSVDLTIRARDLREPERYCAAD